MHFPELDDRLFLSDDFPAEILVESQIMGQTNGSIKIYQVNITTGCIKIIEKILSPKIPT